MLTLMFLLICYGACNNLVYGSAFEGWRQFLAKFGTGGYSIYKLFTCMMCLSTWMGFVISAIMLYGGLRCYLPIHGLAPVVLVVFLHGLLATGGVWFIHTVQEYFESKS